MSECSICDRYSENTTPVSFANFSSGDPNVPEIIKPFLGIGNYLDDLDASRASEEFWDNCARLCPDCFKKYYDWIVWWG